MFTCKLSQIQTFEKTSLHEEKQLYDDNEYWIDKQQLGTHDNHLFSSCSLYVMFMFSCVHVTVYSSVLFLPSSMYFSLYTHYLCIFFIFSYSLYALYALYVLYVLSLLGEEI